MAVPDGIFKINGRSLGVALRHTEYSFGIGNFCQFSELVAVAVGRDCLTLGRRAATILTQYKGQKGLNGL